MAKEYSHEADYCLPSQTRRAHEIYVYTFSICRSLIVKLTSTQILASVIKQSWHAWYLVIGNHRDTNLCSECTQSIKQSRCAKQQIEGHLDPIEPIVRKKVHTLTFTIMNCTRQLLITEIQSPKARS